MFTSEGKLDGLDVFINYDTNSITVGLETWRGSHAPTSSRLLAAFRDLNMQAILEMLEVDAVARVEAVAALKAKFGKKE